MTAFPRRLVAQVVHYSSVAALVATNLLSPQPVVAPEPASTAPTVNEGPVNRAVIEADAAEEPTDRFTPVQALAAPPGSRALTIGTGAVYLAAARHIGRSTNFYTSSPTWVDIQGALPLGVGNADIIEFVLDPFFPTRRAWVALGHVQGKSAGSVWRTDNLNDPTPTWTLELTDSQIVAAVGGASAWVKRIQASRLRPGLIVVAVGNNNSQLSIGRSMDYGETWTWPAGAINVGDTTDRAWDWSCRIIMSIGCGWGWAMAAFPTQPA